MGTRNWDRVTHPVSKGKQNGIVYRFCEGALQLIRNFLWAKRSVLI